MSFEAAAANPLPADTAEQVVYHESYECDDIPDATMPQSAENADNQELSNDDFSPPFPNDTIPTPQHTAEQAGVSFSPNATLSGSFINDSPYITMPRSNATEKVANPNSPNATIFYFGTAEKPVSFNYDTSQNFPTATMPCHDTADKADNPNLSNVTMSGLNTAEKAGSSYDDTNPNFPNVTIPTPGQTAEKAESQNVPNAMLSRSCPNPTRTANIAEYESFNDDLPKTTLSWSCPKINDKAADKAVSHESFSHDHIPTHIPFPSYASDAILPSCPPPYHVNDIDTIAIENYIDDQFQKLNESKNAHLTVTPQSLKMFSNSGMHEAKQVNSDFSENDIKTSTMPAMPPVWPTLENSVNKNSGKSSLSLPNYVTTGLYPSLDDLLESTSENTPAYKQTGQSQPKQLQRLERAASSIDIIPNDTTHAMAIDKTQYPNEKSIEKEIVFNTFSFEPSAHSTDRHHDPPRDVVLYDSSSSPPPETHIPATSYTTPFDRTALSAIKKEFSAFNAEGAKQRYLQIQKENDSKLRDQLISSSPSSTEAEIETMHNQIRQDKLKRGLQIFNKKRKQNKSSEFSSFEIGTPLTTRQQEMPIVH